MSSLTAIREAFLKAMEAPVAERDEVLATLDPPLRSEVIALLSAHESAGDFLSRAGLPEDFAPPGTPIGPYRVVETIGHGGMGIVYRACRADGEFDRDVAIKFVGGRLFAPEAERRFIAERRILALLDHPNIVRMADCGGASGIW